MIRLTLILSVVMWCWTTTLMSAADENDALVDVIRTRYDQPALAVAVVSGDEIVGLSAVGTREFRGDTGVTTDDRFHIGSCTKAFTSTLVGLFVDEGKLNWRSTIVELLPDLKGAILPAYESVTIEQLLGHRAGILEFTRPGEKEGAMTADLPGDIREQRAEFARRLLNEPPMFDPGAGYRYSNADYAIVAHILESISGKTWQELVRTRIFEPLKMEHSGFDLPQLVNTDEPAGHLYRASGYIRTTQLTAHQMIPQSIESAGDIHASPGDMARFLREHLKGLRGVDGLLKATTVKRLHRTHVQNYAMGWFNLKIDDKQATAHNGSAGFFFTIMAIWPEENLAAVAMTNAGTGEDACLEILTELHAKYTQPRRGK